MNTTLLRTSCAILAIVAGASSFASPRDHASSDRADAAQSRHAVPASRGDSMARIANASSVGDPAYGWSYFSDPTAPRAVVISPAGEYFLSLGKGLQAVAGRGVRER